jgi:hypothetical protein
MPLPSMETLHKYADAVLDIVKKANAIGASVELALQALHDRFFEKHDPSDGFQSSGAYEQLPTELQREIDDKVADITPQ